MYNCIIIGLGPVGATLGNLLGIAGLKTLIIEREQSIYPFPRAIHGDDEILRIFQQINLAEEIQEQILPFTQMQLAKNPETPLINISLENPKKPLGFPSDYWFYQPHLEKTLRKGLERFLHIEVRLGWETQSIIQKANSISLKIKNLENGNEETVHSSFLIGADGANSWVRKQLKNTLNSLNFDQKWLVIDTKTLSNNADSKWGNTHQQICNPKQPITYIPGVGQHRRWEIMLQELVNIPNEQEVKALLSLNSQHHIDRMAVYNFHALWANKWNTGNIFLCGDAAHQMPPFLGQGLCSGIRDAHNLAWKLKWASKKHVSKTQITTLFNTYQQERMPHTLNLMRGAILLGKIIQTRKKTVAYIRNSILKLADRSSLIKRIIKNKVVKKEKFRNGFLGKNCTKLAGSLFPQSGEERLIDYSDNYLGEDMTIVSIKSIKDLPQDWLETGFMKSWELLEEKHPILYNWFIYHKIDFAIIRPDRVIFDAGKDVYLRKTIQYLQQLTLGKSATNN